MIWFNEDHRSFYPRCFDLTKDDDLEDFIYNFKVTYASSLLKYYIEEVRRNPYAIKAPLPVYIVKSAISICQYASTDME